MDGGLEMLLRKTFENMGVNVCILVQFDDVRSWDGKSMLFQTTLFSKHRTEFIVTFCVAFSILRNST